MKVVNEIHSETGNTSAEFLKLDLADLQSVRDAASSFLSRDLVLDRLINNAGLAGHDGVTRQGFELTFGVNHLGHFLFTHLLEDALKKAERARIVNVASRAHYRAKGIDFSTLRAPKKTYTGMKEYSVSKLCNVLHAKSLADRLKGDGITAYSLHPGVVASDVWRRVPQPGQMIIKRFMITNEEGALTTLHCAMSDEAGDETGLYYDKCRTKEPSELAHDRTLAAELYERSLEWMNE